MNAYGKIAMLLVGVAISVGIFYFVEASQIAQIGTKMQIKIDNQYIVADTARTSAERSQGLGGRTSLNINDGMYFIFPDAESYGFWMKDMNFPIDIVWINGDTVIGYTANVPAPAAGTPDSALQIYYPPAPVDRVLELHAGRAAMLHLSVGDTVVAKPLLPGSTSTASPQ
ncbi:DUF192 domain-containing protein [Patescibacteria group bacterium]|nr:DUF192 domain-containing protein [Patescibacteria group bacterium]